MNARNREMTGVSDYVCTSTFCVRRSNSERDWTLLRRSATLPIDSRFVRVFRLYNYLTASSYCNKQIKTVKSIKTIIGIKNSKTLKLT